MISEDEVCQYTTQVLDVVKQNNLDPTFFEVVTMIAFLKFQASKVDYAVIECGIGARLDSTNIITPEISCITSVGLDHCEALGDTIEQIAYEKSFVIKEGKPFVAGFNTPVE